MSDSAGMSRRLASIALDLEHETSAQDTLEAAVRLAVETIEGCDAASISIVHGRKSVQTPASTSPEAALADKLQYEHEEGPCVAAIFDDDLISSPDLAAEERWPEWAHATLAETPVRSMLCFRLCTRGRKVGALNLYAYRPRAFSHEDLDLGVVFAAHVAIAASGAEHRKHTAIAMDARTVIGQAQGILMERFDLDTVPAFAVLKRLSQNTNRKLHEIAVELVTTRELPDQD